MKVKKNCKKIMILSMLITVLISISFFLIQHFNNKNYVKFYEKNQTKQELNFESTDNEKIIYKLNEEEKSKTTIPSFQQNEVVKLNSDFKNQFKLKENEFSSPINLENQFNLKAEPLSKDDAFKLEVNHYENSINVFFKIAPKHYLYSEQLLIKINNIEYKNFKISNLVEKHDGYYGNTKVIYDSLNLPINVSNVESFYIRYQGCSESFNLCYPPEEKTFKYKSTNPIKIKDYGYFDNFINFDFNFDIDNLISKLKNNSLIINVLVFFLAGVLVSLTPCVLPMIPIISSIIVNQKNKSYLNAFKLSLSYVIGTSLAYSMIGIIAALTSINLQIHMQSPIFITIAFSLLILLALSMADVFSLNSSSSFNNFLNNKISKISNKGIFSTILIGFLSALIISPCVAAPLAAASLYVSSTGNWILGAITLFSFGMGSGLILILISTSLNKIKIKSGNFMNEVKYLFSFILAMTAFYVFERIIGKEIMIIFMSGISFLYAVKLLERGKTILRLIISVLTLIIASFLILNVNLKNISSEQNNIINKNTINSIMELNELKNNNDKIFIKVTADWCIYCKKMEDESFSGYESIDLALKSFNKYDIDLSNISKEKELLIASLGVVAPPAIIIIDKSISHVKMGYMEKNKILSFIKDSEGLHMENCKECSIKLK